MTKFKLGLLKFLIKFLGVNLNELDGRSVLHIQVGDKNWTPTEQDLNDVRDAFLLADADPTGAIIVTRNTVKAANR
jgi:hypothetical protein